MPQINHLACSLHIDWAMKTLLLTAFLPLFLACPFHTTGMSKSLGLPTTTKTNISPSLTSPTVISTAAPRPTSLPDIVTRSSTIRTVRILYNIKSCEVIWQMSTDNSIHSMKACDINENFEGGGHVMWTTGLDNYQLLYVNRTLAYTITPGGHSVTTTFCDPQCSWENFDTCIYCEM